MALNPITTETYYGNILVICPKGVKLCTVDEKRVKWYLSRNLAKIVKPIDPYPKTVQLTFEPKGRPKNDLGLAVKETQCVVCGSKESLSVHHVVPHSIRRHFPAKHKSKQHLWCQLLCEQHHLEIERANSHIIRKEGSLKKEQKRHSPTVASPKARARLSLYHIVRNNHTNNVPEIKLAELLKIAQFETLPDIVSLEKYSNKLIKPLNKSNKSKSLFGKRFIRNSGGIKATKELFKNEFLKILKPKYLTYGALHDIS